MSALHHATSRKVQTVEDDGTLCHPTVGAPGKRGKVRYLPPRARRRARARGRPDPLGKRCSGTCVPRRLVERESIESDKLFPRQLVGEASARSVAACPRV